MSNKELAEELLIFVNLMKDFNFYYVLLMFIANIHWLFL